MLDINLILKNPQTVKKACEDKGVKSEIVDRLLKVDETRRQLIQGIEKLRAEKNKLGSLAKELGKEEREKGKKIKETLKKLEPDLRAVEGEFESLLYQIPNPAAADVPVGKNENENKIIRKWGKPKKFDFKVRSHYQLGEELDLVDTRRAAKVSGTRFGYLKNEAVLLEFALIKLTFDLLLKEGFQPIIPPVMISLDSMRGMGYLEHGGQDEMYVLEKDNLVLVGTSEQAIGPMRKDEILEEKELPRRYVGFSTCFRREAGSYGKDTRGILRVHQFNKIEMFSFTKPEDSDQEHEYLLNLEEKLVRKLELPYQVSKMCTGDLGAPVARKYDIEVWFPNEGKYRETHSTSTCTDYQARRLNIRYKRLDGGLDFVHTMNGTAFAIGRTILAILENYQQKDGSVLVPEVLQKFVGKKKISRR